MAEMIPDRLPSGASAGEKKVFALLQDLPDDIIVYYEPVVADRYPDFIVIIPSIGLLVIEVKGWYPNAIERADNADVVINARGQREVCRNPVRQARDYKFQLMNVARRHPETGALLEQAGKHEGKFVFPFGHLAILNNCTRQQLDERGLSEVFPPGRVFARDEFEAAASNDTIDRLMVGFDPWWPFEPLSERQIAILRAIIHPEIVLSAPAQAAAAEPAPLKVMDLRQERNAHSLGEGHRIVYGVAGSGKTVILVARARLLAEDAAKRVLILCYNRALAAYFHGLFAHMANVACLNFHQWGVQCNGIAFDRNEDEDGFGARLLQRLQTGAGEAHRYDAAFIDEAQDFSRSWFQCAKLALKEPDDGDLLIVGDGSQSLYRRRSFTWAEAGVNAVGRTINRRFDLDRNYRNTREILKIAAAFVAADAGPDDPESRLQIIRPDPDVALRSGPMPEMLTVDGVDGELRIAADKIVAWLEQGLRPAEIAVLYRANANPRGWVRDLALAVSRRTAVYCPNEGFKDSSGVCVTTMHAAKGLQWRAVLVMRADTMPFIPDRDATRDEQERLERGLMYVAMTRAEEMLAFTRSTTNGFAMQIERLIGQA
jgi:UvrD-like helicase family protein/nuclease-like protein/AAA domain-containing protein